MVNEFMLKMWTIQPASILQAWLNQDFIGNMSSNIEDPLFADAYKWMMQQMLLKLGEPLNGVLLPSWAWYQYDGIKHLKPNIDEPGWGMPGEKTVRIELALPESLVILSDYMLWHSVLNGSYLGNSEIDATVFDMRYDNAKSISKSLDKASDVMTSWQRVFDLDLVDDYYQPLKRQDRSIQATFWSAPTDCIENVETFIAR